MPESQRPPNAQAVPGFELQAPPMGKAHCPERQLMPSQQSDVCEQSRLEQQRAPTQSAVSPVANPQQSGPEAHAPPTGAQQSPAPMPLGRVQGMPLQQSEELPQ